jgi:hypothetical protein
MRGKGKNDRFSSCHAADTLKFGYDLPVPEVNSVKSTNGDHRPLYLEIV